MAHFGEKKKFLLMFTPFTGLIKKQLFKQIQIFIRICPFSNMVRKTNFRSISVLVSEIVTFWLKREVLCEYSSKCFKTTERQSLAACGTLGEEKKFMLICTRFYWFGQKQLFKQIQFFIRICPFSNMVRKKKFSLFQCSFLR